MSNHGSALTLREHLVAGLVAEGLTNREIASRLGLTATAVNMHIRDALGRLGLSSRVDLAAWYLRHDS